MQAEWNAPPERLSVTVDTIAGLGTYVETEVIGEDPERAAELLQETETALLLHRCPVVTKPYRDLVMEHAQHITRADDPTES